MSSSAVRLVSVTYNKIRLKWTKYLVIFVRMDSGFSLWDPEVIGIIDLTANKKDCFGELMT